MRAPRRGPLLEAFWKLHKAAWRLSGGRLGRRLQGMPVLRLTTTGRRSGQPRDVLLYFLPHGDAFVVVASNVGEPRHPAWYLNLLADPTAEVEVEGNPVPVQARMAVGDERTGLWERLVEASPHYAEYARRTERDIPVVVLEPVDAETGVSPDSG